MLLSFSIVGQELSNNKLSFKSSSISLQLGNIREWKAQDFGSCANPNTGISNSLSYRSFLTQNWFLRAKVNADRINDNILDKSYWAGSYQISFGRVLFKKGNSNINSSVGVSLTQEMIVTYQCLDFGNGLEPQNISDQYRASSFFGKINIEYEHEFVNNWSVGLAITNYYDLINFGRTDLFGLLRYRLE